MVHTRTISLITAFSLLEALPRALAHDHGDQGSEAMDMGAIMTTTISSAMPSATVNISVSATPESYFTYPSMGGLMLGHIIIMTIAWFFMLPIGKQEPAGVISAADTSRYRHHAQRRSFPSRPSYSTLLSWCTQHRPSPRIYLYPQYTQSV